MFASLKEYFSGKGKEGRRERTPLTYFPKSKESIANFRRLVEQACTSSVPPTSDAAREILRAGQGAYIYLVPDVLEFGFHDPDVEAQFLQDLDHAAELIGNSPLKSASADREMMLFRKKLMTALFGGDKDTFRAMLDEKMEQARSRPTEEEHQHTMEVKENS